MIWPFKPKPGEPLAEPPEHLTEEQAKRWRELVKALQITEKEMRAARDRLGYD